MYDLEEKQSHDFLTFEEIILVTHHDTISDSSGKTTREGQLILLHLNGYTTKVVFVHTLARSSSFFHEMIQHVARTLFSGKGIILLRI